MPTPHAIIEFQESYCQVFVWESEKAVHTLRYFLRMPLQKVEGKTENPGDSPAIQANGQALRQAIRSTGLKIQEALVLVPKEWVRLRVVTLPTTEVAELPEMARFEAQRYIPFNMERHIISHHVLGVEGIGGTRVILAAIDSPPADEITATMEAAGIRVSALDVSALALTNALLHSEQWNQDAHPTVVQIDIGQKYTDINILYHGFPIFARSIGLGVDKLFTSASPDAPMPEEITADRIAAMDLLAQSELIDDKNGANAASAAQAPAQWVTRLVNEIRRTYDFAHREFECEPMTQAFISGPGALLGNLDQVILSSLGIEPVQLAPFNDKIQLDAKSLSDSHSPLTYVIGTGGLVRDVWEKSLRVNLLPPLYIQRHELARRKRSLVTTGLLALALVACFCIFVWQLVSLREQQLEDYEAAIAKTQERVEEIRYRETVLKILKKNTSQQSSALAILNTLSGWNNLFGDTNMRVSISKFDYNALEGVTLGGNAWEHKDLNDFVVKLQETKHFGKVTVNKQPWVQLEGRPEQILNFELSCGFAKKPAPSSNPK